MAITAQAAHTEPERLMAVYEGVMLALDAFEDDRAQQRSIYSGPTRLDVFRSSAGRIVLTHLSTYPYVRGEGCASSAVRAACDFADLLGWTLIVEPARAVGGDEAGAVRLFSRFGFTGRDAAAGVLYRLPAATV